MRTFPGTEYGPDAAPPTAARIQQISLEQCQPAVERYLGDKFDPNSKFTISMLWSGDKAWKQDGERRMLCGLQLPGADNQQIAFKGQVAEVDQSKVWPAGTCLGIDPPTNQPTDVPVDCGAPHAMEVTGAVNLAEKFSGGLPPDADQDAFIKDACTRMTDAYLAPVQLRTTTLTLIYSTISLPSWTAGSHQVACSIGATLGNGGWATLINPAKGPLLINGQPPIPPPDIPEERLNLPSIPLLPTSRRPRTRRRPVTDQQPVRLTATRPSTCRNRRVRPTTETAGAHLGAPPPRATPSSTRRRPAAGAGAVRHRPGRPATAAGRPTAAADCAAACAGPRPPAATAAWGARPAAATRAVGARADGPAAVRRIGLRRTGSDSARAGQGDRQRRGPGRGSPPRGPRPAGPLRGHRADRA